MFITVACGAISGFHATQSPLMARCMKSERQGHMVFYGAMISEGIIVVDLAQGVADAQDGTRAQHGDAQLQAVGVALLVDLEPVGQLRGHLRLPRHSVPADGPMHEV